VKRQIRAEGATPRPAALESSPLASLVVRELVPAAGWQPEWEPFSLTLGLTEFCLLEGVSVQTADALLRTAATLVPPQSGRVRHWGEDLFALPRRQLYPRRRMLAFVSPRQALLPRLTVAENLTLVLLTSRQRPREVGLPHPLLEQLDLLPYLSSYPRQLPPASYQLALWAKELLKNPRLILGVLAGQEEPFGLQALAPNLLPVLEEYQRQRRGAVLLAGPWLAAAHPLAQRQLSLQGQAWREESLPRQQGQPLTAFLAVL
jgi:ABC-type lipoprotein export system ATPase subunit